MNGKAWRTARDEAGLTIDDAAEAVRNELGRKTLTRSKLQRAETDDASLDIVVLAVLAKTYGKRLSEIDPDAAVAFSSLRDLLVDVRTCSNAFAGQAA